MCSSNTRVEASRISYLAIALHYTSQFAIKIQVEELYFFMIDVKVLRANCWSTYLFDCQYLFHGRNTVDGVNHLTSIEHEPSWLGLDFFFRRECSLDQYVHRQLLSNPAVCSLPAV
ncbi:hypothetical protein AVEN_104864-1 [Araneus ventricosus]|uniref:Uncharacterized protein n=1 Tax=Araneus ventricosus TaxID=182803 RepID=A0A4Y2INB1_ARAVE|nr:hypothetical protein AVEN_104864-1 [Araneus ventricosus]